MDRNALYDEFLRVFPPDPPPAAREVADLFVVCQDAYFLFPLLAGVRWTELDLHPVHSNDAEAFLLPHALAYYLPAFLTPALGDPEAWKEREGWTNTMWRFVPNLPQYGGWYKERRNLRGQAIAFFEDRFSGLTAAQRETVARFLAWTVDQNRGDEDFPSISEEDRLEYWPLPGAQT